MRRKNTWVASVAALAMASTASTGLFAHAEDTFDDGVMPGAPYASDSVRGMLIAENHRIAITALADSLNYIANKENLVSPLSTQARNITQKETETISEVAQAIQKTATRGSLTKVVAGHDYQNLGVIKKELENLHETLAKLENMKKYASGNTDEAILNTQIQSLTEDRKTLERFVSAHEVPYGLFGWFNKMVAETTPTASNNS